MSRVSFKFESFRGPVVVIQIWRILHSADSAWSEAGFSQYELLCTRKLLADGELHRSRGSAAVARTHSPGQRGQGRKSEFDHLTL